MFRNFVCTRNFEKDNSPDSSTISLGSYSFAPLDFSSQQPIRSVNSAVTNRIKKSRAPSVHSFPFTFFGVNLRNQNKKHKNGRQRRRGPENQFENQDDERNLRHSDEGKCQRQGGRLPRNFNSMYTECLVGVKEIGILSPEKVKAQNPEYLT